MDIRKIACMAAASFIGLTLTVAATQPAQSRNHRTVVVTGRVHDPEAPRTVVTYRDLNLAQLHDQRTLRYRIVNAASTICEDRMESTHFHNQCYFDAISSTHSQVADAIDRAQARLAGRSVGRDVAITMAISAQ